VGRVGHRPSQGRLARSAAVGVVGPSGGDTAEGGHAGDAGPLPGVAERESRSIKELGLGEKEVEELADLDELEEVGEVFDYLSYAPFRSRASKN
jgi:hypothetical protein